MAKRCPSRHKLQTPGNGFDTIGKTQEVSHVVSRCFPCLGDGAFVGRGGPCRSDRRDLGHRTGCQGASGSHGNAVLWGAFCGKLVRAYASNGAEVTTPNVGRELVWDLRAQGGGKYGNGRIFVPVMRSDFPVEMTLAGNTLRLRACNALGVCRSQTWSRVN